MAKQMQQIDPNAPMMRMLMGAAAVASQGYRGVVTARKWLRRNPLVLAALVVIFIAIVLKLFGVM
jgi:hypothetical protein